jgi:hypothetical protein
VAKSSTIKIAETKVLFISRKDVPGGPPYKNPELGQNMEHMERADLSIRAQARESVPTTTDRASVGTDRAAPTARVLYVALHGDEHDGIVARNRV